MTTTIERTSQTAPEQADWDRHQRTIAAVPPQAGWWRGCFGLAMLADGEFVNDGKSDYLADADVRWATMVDLPADRFYRGGAGHVTWAAVRPTANRLGVPTLAAHTPGAMGWDYCFQPQRNSGGLETLPLGQCEALARAFNALQWTMTTHAYWRRPNWRRGQLTQEIKRLALPPATSPAAWTPIPYLGFPAESAYRLYRRVTRPGLGIGAETRYYPLGLRAEFVKALADGLAYRAPGKGYLKSIAREVYEGVPCITLRVFTAGKDCTVVRFGRAATVHVKPGAINSGELLASEPVKFERQTDPLRAWNCLVPRLFGNKLDEVLRFWFDRQAISLAPGYVHLPSRLAAVAALGSATGPLYWNVTHAAQYLRADCDAFVFPAVTMENSLDLIGALPHDFAYDLTPDTPRFFRSRRA